MGSKCWLESLNTWLWMRELPWVGPAGAKGRTHPALIMSDVLTRPRLSGPVMVRNHCRCLPAQAAEEPVCQEGPPQELAQWADSHWCSSSADRHHSREADAHARKGRVLTICSCTPLKYTPAQMMDKVHIPLDRPAGRLLTFVTLSSSSARDASKRGTRKENRCHFVLKHAGSFSVVQRHVNVTPVEVHVTGFEGATSCCGFVIRKRRRCLPDGAEQFIFCLCLMAYFTALI